MVCKDECQIAQGEKEHHVEKNKQKLRRILTLKLQAKLQVSQQQVWLILEWEENEGGFVWFAYTSILNINSTTSKHFRKSERFKFSSKK